jgi:hypothetical protein
MNRASRGGVEALARIAFRASAAVLVRHAFALVGLCAGIVAGWFALVAGLVLGAMLDVARTEARSRGRVSAFFAKPEAGPPPEPLEGFAAAACIALQGEWTGVGDREARRALFDRFSRSVLPPRGRARREAERIIDVAARCLGPDLPALARSLATASEAAPARELLADWAFALAALGGARLDAASELALRAALGDCGLGARELLAARLRAFPGERDPWTVLGLAPGAPRSEIKRAYRRLSRLFHPDASPGDEGERFRELVAAYDELTLGPR